MSKMYTTHKILMQKLKTHNIKTQYQNSQYNEYVYKMMLHNELHEYEKYEQCLIKNKFYKILKCEHIYYNNIDYAISLKQNYDTLMYKLIITFNKHKLYVIDDMIFGNLCVYFEKQNLFELLKNAIIDYYAK